MELTEILNYIFRGTSLVGIVTTLIFWSKSKRAKEAETVTAESNAKQDGLLTDIVTYLNGDFQEFLKRNHNDGK